MGRGRNGVGYKVQTHVTVKVERLNFENKIKDATSETEQKYWTEKKLIAEKKRVNPPTYFAK